MDIAMGILLDAVIAGAASGGILVVLARPWRAAAPGALAMAASAVAVGVGCFVGRLVMQGWPEMPPLDAAGWLPWIAVGVGVICAAVSGPRLSWRWKYLVQSAAAFASMRVLTLGMSLEGHVIERLFAGSTTFTILVAVIRSTPRWPSAHLTLSALVTSAAASACLLLSGSLKLAQEAGALAGAVGGAAAVCIVLPRASFVAGHAVFVIALGMAYLAGCVYSELSGWSAVALAASAAAPCVVDWYWVDEHPMRWRLRVALGFAIFFALVAAVIARFGSDQV